MAAPGRTAKTRSLRSFASRLMIRVVIRFSQSQWPNAGQNQECRHSRWSARACFAGRTEPLAGT